MGSAPPRLLMKGYVYVKEPFKKVSNQAATLEVLERTVLSVCLVCILSL